MQNIYTNVWYTVCTRQVLLKTYSSRALIHLIPPSLIKKSSLEEEPQVFLGLNISKIMLQSQIPIFKVQKCHVPFALIILTHQKKKQPTREFRKSSVEPMQVEIYFCFIIQKDLYWMLRIYEIQQQKIQGNIGVSFLCHPMFESLNGSD